MFGNRSRTCSSKTIGVPLGVVVTGTSKAKVSPSMVCPMVWVNPSGWSCGAVLPGRSRGLLGRAKTVLVGVGRSIKVI